MRGGERKRECEEGLDEELEGILAKSILEGVL